MGQQLWQRPQGLPETERRTEDRLESALEVKLWIGDVPVTGVTKDISASGIKLLVRTKHDFTIGDCYRLEIILDPTRAPIKAVAQTVRIDEPSAGGKIRGVAFHFAEIADSDRNGLRDFVHIKRIEKNTPSYTTVDPVDVTVWVNGIPVSCTTEDICALGTRVLMQASDAVHLNDTYKMQIIIPRVKHPLWVSAKATRMDQAHDDDHGYRVLFQFADIPVEEQILLRNYILEARNMAFFSSGRAA